MVEDIKKIATHLKPKFIIGKNNLTDNLISSIDEYIRKNKVVKIKVSSVAKSKDILSIAETLASKIDSKIINIIGFTFVLHLEE